MTLALISMNMFRVNYGLGQVSDHFLKKEDALNFLLREWVDGSRSSFLQEYIGNGDWASVKVRHKGADGNEYVYINGVRRYLKDLA